MTSTGGATRVARQPGLPAVGEVCRLTVAGSAGRADLAVPATAPLSDVLTLVLPRLVGHDAEGQAWILQRPGEDPLDPASTPESAELRDGDVLYLRPADRALTAAEFDDVAVGVADAVTARGDLWRPAWTRRLLAGLACLMLAAFAFAVLGAQPWWRVPLYLGAGAMALGAGSALLARRAGDAAATVGGLGAVVLGALAGLTGRHGLFGLIAPGGADVLLAGGCTAAVAALLLAALPQEADGSERPLFGTALVAGLAAVAGGCLAMAAHWDTTRVAATMAVAVFVTTARSVRLLLRAARLRVPDLPRTADELQEGIEPEPRLRVARRTARALAWLDALTIGAALVYAVAFIELLHGPQRAGWAQWSLAGLLAAAVLLRARAMPGRRQRTSLAVSGTFGFALLLVTCAAKGGLLGTLGSAALLAASGGLLAAAAQPSGRRLLPVWGDLADQAETWTAVALVPLLLQMLHTYSYFRHLIG